MGGGTITVDGALECPATITGGGHLGGVGNVASVVNGGGTVEPGDGTTAGGLTVGSYTQGADGTLSVRQETAEGGLSDHLLHATGQVELGGTVELAPASPPASFLVIDSASEPQGYFAHVIAPSLGSPWTIGYGPHGAIAVSGGSVPVVPQVMGSLQAGGTISCGLGDVGSAPVWEPRGEVAYAWNGPFFEAGFPGPIGPRASHPGLLAEQLDPQLDAYHTASVAVPADAVGFRIACSIRYWMPAGGSRSSVTEGGESAPTKIAGPYRSVGAPAIAGSPIPGSHLTCSPGRWEGTPGSITYVWMRGQQGGDESENWVGVGVGPRYTVRDADGGATLACIVTARYGAIAVPAEASLAVPARPQPTLCSRRPLTLVSGRPAADGMLLFGAAAQWFFGHRVVLLHRVAGGRKWRRVATGRVNGSGYFTLRVRARGGAPGGSFRVAIGRTLSNVLDFPGALQIVSDRSRPGESVVDLGLSSATRSGGRVTVSQLNASCSSGPQIAAARLGAGGDLQVRLTAARGTGLGYYLASATVGHTGFSIELIVPALPLLLAR